MEHNIPLIAHSNTQHRKWRTTSKDRSANEEGFKPRNKVGLQQKAPSRIPIYFPCLPETLLWKSAWFSVYDRAEDFSHKVLHQGSVKCAEGQGPHTHPGTTASFCIIKLHSLLGQTEGKKLLTVRSAENDPIVYNFPTALFLFIKGQISIIIIGHGWSLGLRKSINHCCGSVHQGRAALYLPLCWRWLPASLTLFLQAL